MSKKTDYKRLFRNAQGANEEIRQAGLFYRDQAKQALVAMNYLLNYVQKLITAEEFTALLKAIGAEERTESPVEATPSAPAEEPKIITDPSQVTPEVAK